MQTHLNRRGFVKSSLMLAATSVSSMRAYDPVSQPNIINTRRDLGELVATDDPTLAIYAKAVDILKKLPTSDFRRWDNLAKIHTSHCPHGNWFFLPWHRAYLAMFENIIRDVAKAPDFALPYWDWTKVTQIPAPFWTGSLKDDTRRRSASDTVPQEFTGLDVMQRILNEKLFGLFGSTQPDSQDSLNERFQQAEGKVGQLEFTPHNGIHWWIGGNMGYPPTAALDPIFWLHHCNVDRIWAAWNSNNNLNPSEQLWRDFTFRQNFTNSHDKRYDVIVKSLEDTTALGYRYQLINPFSDLSLAALSPPTSESNFSEKFLSTTSKITTVGEPVSFDISISEKAASQLKSTKIDFGRLIKSSRFLATIRNVDIGQNTDLIVRVFLDHPQVSSKVPLNDPHYVGSLAFFGNTHDPLHGNHLADTGVGPSFVLDLTETIENLKRIKWPITNKFNIQLLPVSFNDQKIESLKVKFEGIDILSE
jgi:tyrosinase